MTRKNLLRRSERKRKIKTESTVQKKPIIAGSESESDKDAKSSSIIEKPQLEGENKNSKKVKHKKSYYQALHKASWIDDIPKELIVASQDQQTRTNMEMVKETSFKGLTRMVGMDCEFVGVGYRGEDNALARVSIVNQFGHVLLDEYVRPNEKVVDYRTAVSGIHPWHLKPDGPAKDFQSVHNEVGKIIDKRIVVGHALHNDFKVLMLSHPKKNIRDTSKYRPFKRLFSGGTPSLKRLTETVLQVPVQQGEHDSVQDARAAMRLYTSVKRVWEAQITKFTQGKKRFKQGKKPFVDPLAGFVAEKDEDLSITATRDQPYLTTLGQRPNKKTKRELFYERRYRAYAKVKAKKDKQKLKNA